MVQCKVCKTTIEKGDFCDAHSIAKTNLEKRYADWVIAYRKLSRKEYLTFMANDQDIPIGDWAREVADYLLKEEL
ncbi:MAG: hypothetical protein JXA54_17150 [Candidatus Heimdallarchaeota archaeon]|nr:hypothetical protein [Candidatus Heimdallarchaeota archaeon]